MQQPGSSLGLSKTVHFRHSGNTQEGETSSRRSLRLYKVLVRHMSFVVEDETSRNSMTESTWKTSRI